MRHKLLNFSKNLIIALGLVVIVMILFFTTSSYAASGDTLGKLMRQTVSDWYRFILRVSISVYTVAYLIIVLKLLVDRTPERMKIVKESIGHFIFMFAVIYFLHYIMLSIIMLNAEGINTAKSVGANFSGIDMQNDEYDLYETALSKAYEFSSVPGFIGLLMYLLLVYYTYKFVIVYAKRYINIIVLIILAPIIFVLSSIKRILTGVSDGRIGKWFKEFIFNVVIQTLHAIFYAILIGLTLKMSDNNENLIGALLTLVLFGFIFKIDAVIRKIFNFVGGSTKINSSKTVGAAINVVGGAVNTGLGAIGNGAENLGNNIGEKGFKEGFKQSMSDAKDSFSGKINQFGENLQQLPDTVKQKAIDFGSDMQGKAVNAFETAKAEAKDYNNILNGERVKANLTAEEIVNEMHNMEEKKGLEGLRQGIQHIGTTIGTGFTGIGKYTTAKLEKAYVFTSRRVKAGILEAQKEFQQDVQNLENDVEMIKRIPKVIKSLKKKQKYIKTANGLNLDVSNTMMLVVDTDVDPEELREELLAEYGEGIDVSAYVFEKVGAQTFLSPAVGSPRMGMAVLAEERYEEAAEHKIDELVTGKKRKKKKIKKASRRQSRKEIKKASKSIQKSQLVNKTYKFSRFSPDSARKITNRMLKKSREQNRYLITINKAYEDIQVDNLKPRGRIKQKATDITHTVRATRKNVIRSVRQIKLSQLAAIANNKELTRKARAVEMANNVAGQIMNATNKIRLGFRQIDNMTPGQVGLRKMIKEGTARELSSGLIAMKQNATVEDKLKATGVVKSEEEKTIVQFVVTESGELVQQVVDTEGKIVQPAVTKDGELVIHHVVQEISQTDTQDIVQEETTSEQASEQVVQRIVTLEGKIVEQVVNSDNTIATEEYTVVDNGGKMLQTQVQEALANSITDEELGVTEETTVEEKAEKLEQLMEDIQRTASTQPLLEQVIAEASEEEKEMDEILLSAMSETGISTVSELKQLTFSDGSDEKLDQKRKMFEKVVTEQMVSTGVLTSLEAEDDDVVGDALDVLNSRVQTLTAKDSDILLDTAAEMERTRIAEELINKGEFTINNPPTDEDIDKKVGTLSDLLVDLAKETIDNSTRFPRELLKETADAMTDVFEKAAEGTKSEAELAFEAELEKAEKKWAKKHGEEIDTDIAEKFRKQEKGEEEEAIKISLKFFGGVENQGQSVSLSNHHSIKDFYDKATKLEGANLTKTQERFLQVYGEKLREMQLLPFSFAKNPVADMDGWSIYIVTDEEDVSRGDKSLEDNKIDDPIEEDVVEVLEEYFGDIRRIFTNFAEEHEINVFDDLYDNPDEEKELTRRIRTFLFRQGEEDEHNKAVEIVENLYKDMRFTDILKDINEERLAKEEAVKRVKGAKSKVKVQSKEKAEKEAETKVTTEEVEEFKEAEKSNLMDQVLDSVMTKQEEEASVSPDLNNLLNQIKDNKVFVTTPDGGATTQNRRVLQYQTSEGEVMP